MKQVVKFAIMLCALVISAQAQPESRQSRIVDIDGKGVPEVSITETVSCFPTAAPPASATKTYVTDANGNFTWPQLGLPGAGSGCAVTALYGFTLSKPGYTFTRSSIGYKPGPAISFPGIPLPFDGRLPLIHASNAPAWVGVPAASFAGGSKLTSNMIVAGFGPNLAEGNASAGEVLPLMLGNRRVLVTDSTGIERPAKLYFVSTGQINYVLPEGLADGSAVIRLVTGTGELLKAGLTEIGKVAPAIFTANANGKGVPAGLLVRVRPGNVQNYEPLAEFDVTAHRYQPLLIDLGPPEQFLVLALFGTGWRQAASVASVVVTISGVACPVEYVGIQPTYEGVDQINARLPRELIGQGNVEVNVTVNGVAANIVQLRFK